MHHMLLCGMETILFDLNALMQKDNAVDDLVEFHEHVRNTVGGRSTMGGRSRSESEASLNGAALLSRANTHERERAEGRKKLKGQFQKQREKLLNSLKRKKGVVDKFETFFGVKEQVLNNFLAVVVLTHIAMLALHGTYSQLKDYIHWFDLGFHCFYVLEILAKLACMAYLDPSALTGEEFAEDDDDQYASRLHHHDSSPSASISLPSRIKRAFKNYLHHPSSTRRSSTRKLDMYLVFLSFAVGIAFEISRRAWPDVVTELNSPQTVNMFTALMAISTLRLVTLVEELNELVFSLTKGLELLSNYVALLASVIYLFGVSAVYVFGERVPEYFGDFYLAAVTLFQLLVGEGWHEIMYSAVQVTNRMAAWFFCAYMFLVCIIFTQLFVGIIIEMFQMVHQKQKQIKDEEDEDDAGPKGEDDSTHKITTELVLHDLAGGDEEKIKTFHEFLPTVVLYEKYNDNKTMKEIAARVGQDFQHAATIISPRSNAEATTRASRQAEVATWSFLRSRLGRIRRLRLSLMVGVYVDVPGQEKAFFTRLHWSMSADEIKSSMLRDIHERGEMECGHLRELATSFAESRSPEVIQQVQVGFGKAAWSGPAPLQDLRMLVNFHEGATVWLR